MLLQITDWGECSWLESKTDNINRKGVILFIHKLPPDNMQIGQIFMWRLTAPTEALQWYLVHEYRSTHQKVIAFCRQATDLVERLTYNVNWSYLNFFFSGVSQEKSIKD
jgi:hypothetical protein